MNDFSTVALEISHCPLGCGADDETILTGRDLLHGLPGEFTVVKCRACSLMRTSPRPTQETMGFYYPDNYGPYIGTKIGDASQRSSARKLLRPWVKRLVDFNTTRRPDLPPGRMLEVGCASGAFLHQMARDGWDVSGIEFSRSAAEAASAQGYRVHSGPLETAPAPDEPFDLIVGWMVLEHLHEPVESLLKLREWARPGAWLVLSVPNSASFEFRVFKKRLYSLHLPNHLYHFTPDSLKQVLKAGGWDLLEVFHQRLLGNLVASTGYLMRDWGYPRLGSKLIALPEKGAFWNYLLFPLGWLLGLFGQTGRMTVWARLSE